MCRVRDEAFDFLGYTIGRCLLAEDGEGCTLAPSRRRRRSQRLCREISELTERRWGLIDTEEQVARINRKLEGWSNYFRIGPVSKAYRAVDQHTADRLRRWLCRKHKVQGAGTTRYPVSIPVRGAETWFGSKGGGATSRGRKREILSESRMRENRTSGLMSGMWKRSMAVISGTLADERASQQEPNFSLNHRATSRLYLNVFCRS